MPFGVQYTDYISISGPEESSWNVCHNSDKISSNVLFQIRQPTLLKPLSFSFCDFIIESIRTAAPTGLGAFLVETKFCHLKMRKENKLYFCVFVNWGFWMEPRSLEEIFLGIYKY